MKTGKLTLNWIPPSPTNIWFLNEYPYNLTRYEIKETSKVLIFQLVSESRKNWKCSLGLY